MTQEKRAATPSYWIRADLSDADRIRRFEAIPLHERGLPNSTYEFLAASCRYAPQATAIRYVNDPTRPDVRQDFSFAHTLTRVHQTANLIHRQGLHAHDVVSLLLPNTPQAQFALWGGQAACIVSPINWMLEAEAIAAIVRTTGSRMLMAYGGDVHMDVWDKALRVAERCPGLEVMVRLGGDAAGAAPTGLRFLDYDQIIDDLPGERLEFTRTAHPHDLSALFPTGGTTGTPKLVRHTHGNIVASAWLSATVAGIVEGESRLSATPLYHVVGAYAGSLATMARGATLVLATSAGWRHPDLLAHIWRVVESCQVNYLTIVPTILNQLVQQPVDHDISCVKGVLSGAAPLSTDVARRFLAQTGLTVREGYGMTETTSVCMMNPVNGTIKTGSVGLLFPYHRARIVALDCGTGVRDAAPGESGLLALSGPTLADGYAGGAACDQIETGWLNTADIARIDEDGYVWITGRAKDLIIRSGHNIDPKSVEEAFYRHPLVLEAAVVARPDAYAGEVPVAYVALIANAAITPEQLLADVRPHIAERAAVPKTCTIMPGLPKSPLGKILKHRLREDALLRGFAQTLHNAGIATDSAGSEDDAEGAHSPGQRPQRRAVALSLDETSTVRIRLDGNAVTPQQIRDALITFTVPYFIDPSPPV